MRLGQPQIFDQFHFLLLSEISLTTTWQSCRLASSTLWLRWNYCTYFRWLRKHLLFPASLSLIFSYSSLIFAQQDAAKLSLCSINELGRFLLHLIMQLSSVESWNQSSSGGGQWDIWLSQPWIIDRFHFFLLLSELSVLITWQSWRLASLTPWLRWNLCTYFRWLRRHLSFLASLSLIFSSSSIALAQRNAAK